MRLRSVGVLSGLLVCAVGQHSWAQSQMPSGFVRKSATVSERTMAAETERLQELAEKEGKSKVPVSSLTKPPSTDSPKPSAKPTSDGVSDVPIRPKTVTPANAESAIRSALASVNSGMTEIVIRAAECDHHDSVSSRTADIDPKPGRAKRSNSNVGGAASTTKAKWGFGVSNGPDEWGKLSPDYKACRQGRLQSPIDIWTNETAPGRESRISFVYETIYQSIKN